MWRMKDEGTNGRGGNESFTIDHNKRNISVDPVPSPNINTLKYETAMYHEASKIRICE